MRTSRLITVLVVVALSLTGCSNKKKSESGTTKLEAYDFRFDPTPLDVKAGQQVKLTFKNEGKTEHNFSITSLHVSQDAAKDETKTVTFTAPAREGDVQFFCKYHKDTKNMVGTLHVTS